MPIRMSRHISPGAFARRPSISRPIRSSPKARSAIATVIKKEARSIDIPARIGGEEFNLLLPGVDSQGAKIAAERVRKSIESQVLETIGGVTASIGVATFLEHSDRIDEIIVFNPLTKNQIGSIVGLLVNKVKMRLEEKNIKLDLQNLNCVLN